MSPSARTPSKRRPIGNACDRCRRRHLRCDRGRPCGICESHGTTRLCTYNTPDLRTRRTYATSGSAGTSQAAAANTVRLQPSAFAPTLSVAPQPQHTNWLASEMYAVANAPAASFLFTPSENTFFTSGDNCATRQTLPSPIIPVHVEYKAHSPIDTRRSSYASSHPDIPSPTHSSVPNISAYATRLSAAARSSAIRSPWLA